MNGKFEPIRQEVVSVIDLDERGSFKGHVDNQNGKTVFKFSNEDEDTEWPGADGLWLVEDGFMKHGRDTNGLLEYLKTMGVAKPNATMRLEG